MVFIFLCCYLKLLSLLARFLIMIILPFSNRESCGLHPGALEGVSANFLALQDEEEGGVGVGEQKQPYQPASCIFNHLVFPLAFFRHPMVLTLPA